MRDDINPHSDEPLGPAQIKLLPQGPRRPRSVDEEVVAAKDTYVYWWYRCLRANDDYRWCCKDGGKGALGETYRDFGDVFHLPFPMWWRLHGRKIFSETQPRKKVLQIQSTRELDALRLSEDKMFLEIPLTMRRQTVMRQIGKLVKQAYAGREVDIWKQSTAKRMIVKTKIRISTIELLLHVLSTRERRPDLTLYEVGVRAGVRLELMKRTPDPEIPDHAMERRRMTLAVSRYLKQARNLVANAGLGVFPSLKDVKLSSTGIARHPEDIH